MFLASDDSSFVTGIELFVDGGASQIWFWMHGHRLGNYPKGKTYKGTHTPLVDNDLFERVQAVFRGHNKPKYRKHEFAFSGLLRCAYDDCMVTAELKKGKYAYYHCTRYRGRCELPYFREEELESAWARS